MIAKSKVIKGRVACDSYFKRINGALEITIPKLNEMACEKVELASASFSTFIANREATGESVSYSFVLRGYVRHWLAQVWSEYDRIKLVDIVSASEQPQVAISNCLERHAPDDKAARA